MPLSGTLCDPPPALSVTVTAALRLPVAVGVNVTVIVQLFFAPTDDPQLLVWAKSDAFVPVTASEVMVIALPPLTSVMVIVCDALVVPTVCGPKVRLVGENCAAVEVPVIVTVCVPALSVIVSVAVRLLMFDGVKVTLMLQLLVAANVVPQLLVWAKSVAFAPEKAKLLIVSAVAVPFVRITFCAALVVFRTCSGKVNDVGDTDTLDVPVPVRATVCGLDPALSATERAAVRAPIADGVNVIWNVQLPFGGTEVQLLV